MLLGIEARHAWTPPGASEPAITLNRIKDDAGAPVWPRYRVRRISGLMGLGEPEDQRDRPVGRLGEIVRRSNRRGKTAVFEGAIQARTLLELREAEADLRAAFNDLEGEGRMDVTPHPDNAALAAVPPVFYEARALTCDIIDVQGGRTWERLFVVGLRLGDPRYFSEGTSIEEVATETNTPMAFSLPTNSRRPVLTLAAEEPETRLILRNKTSGKSLSIRLPEIWGGENLILDFDARTIVGATAGVDRSALLDPADNSLWVAPEPLPPGSELEFEVTSMVEATTPARSAGAALVAGVSGGTVAWSGVGFVTASDNKYAVAELGVSQKSEYLEAYQFDFESVLPDDADPRAVTLEVERSKAQKEGSALTFSDYRVRLMKTGSAVGTTDKAKAEAWPAADAVAVYGGDQWGETLTRADCVAPGFGFAIAVQAGATGSSKGEAKIDQIRAKVTYKTESTGPVPCTASAVLRWEQGYI